MNAPGNGGVFVGVSIQESVFRSYGGEWLAHASSRVRSYSNII